MSPVIRVAVVVLAAQAAAVMAADPVIKSTMPDGRVVYGEVAMPGAKRVDKVAAPPEHSGVTVVTQEDRARAERIEVPRGGVTVIPQSPKYPAQPSQQGYLANPGGRQTGRSY